MARYSCLTRLEISKFLDISRSTVCQALKNFRSDDLAEDPMFIDDDFRRKLRKFRMRKSNSDDDSYVPSGDSDESGSGSDSNDEIDSVSVQHAPTKAPQSRGNRKSGKRSTEKVRPEAHRNVKTEVFDTILSEVLRNTRGHQVIVINCVVNARGWN
ncbi:hypothetical protein BDQ17DRAFT_1425971 [Cyathus striatus]|nr:hypothetical protein BDQ17DRAFT_1425971 [Cyathus striatus]